MVLDADCLTTLDTTSSMYTYRRVSTLTTSLARYSRNSTASSSGTVRDGQAMRGRRKGERGERQGRTR